MTGTFISIEGGEGTGKTRQVALLAAALEATGRSVCRTREPGGSPGAEQIRELLVGAASWSPLSELLLFASGRADHLEHTIEPALQAGTWVVCDRFVDSTRVYQSYGRGIAATTIAAVDAICPGERLPDLTLVLDMPVQQALERVHQRGGGDRFDGAVRGFHEALREGFRAVAAAHPQRCVLVDADRPVEAVAETIRDMVAVRLDLPAFPAAPEGST